MTGHLRGRWAPLAVLTALCSPACAPAQRAPPAVLPAAPACSEGPADDTSILVGATVVAPRPVIRHTVDSVLADLGYSISVAESRLDQWVTVPRFTWPPGSEHDPWHGDVNPGVQVIVDLAPAHDSTRVSVAASAVCAIESAEAGGRAGSVERTLETVTAVQTASRIAGALGGLTRVK